MWVIVETFNCTEPCVYFAGPDEKTAQRELDKRVAAFSDWDHDHCEAYLKEVKHEKR